MCGCGRGDALCLPVAAAAARCTHTHAGALIRTQTRKLANSHHHHHPVIFFSEAVTCKNVTNLTCLPLAVFSLPPAKQYTKLLAPTAWRACETFIPRPGGDMVVTEASDVFMLGCTFIEVLTGCAREPYDWLMAEDPSGNRLVAYRASDATMNNNPLVVRGGVGVRRWTGTQGVQLSWNTPLCPGLMHPAWLVVAVCAVATGGGSGGQAVPLGH